MTFAELKTAVADWLNRADLNTKIPTFIQLAESRLNRLLDDPEMEVSSTTVATGDYTALPDDFGSMVSISTGNGTLHAVGPSQFASYSGVTGNPRFYVIVDGSIAFAPFNSSATISMVYRRRIPALSDTNTTNWLLTLAPDVYLYETLMQATAFLADDDRAALWKSASEQAIAELRRDGERRRWGSGPVRPRIDRY